MASRKPGAIQPVIKALIIAIIMFLMVGVLGELRTSARGYTGVIDYSILLNTSLSEAVQLSSDEISARNSRSGGIAVAYAVPERVQYLYGASYLSAVAFFVPRSIWPSKPRGAGAHVAAIIYAGMSSAEGYDGGGIPPGAAGEAYWNFGYVGLVGVFILFACFHRATLASLLSRPDDPYAILVYVLSLLVLSSPSSIAIVDFFQIYALLLISRFFFRTSRLLKN